MSTPDLHPSTPVDTGAPPRAAVRRTYRVAGLAGVAAFVAWLAQPVLVSVMSAMHEEEALTWSDVESAPYAGAVQTLVFLAIGVASLLLVLATWRLVTAGSVEPSVGAGAGHVMGVVAAAAWLLVAAESFRTYTSIGASVPAITDDPEVQGALLHGTALDVTAGLLLFVVGFSGWLVMLATTGRRAGVVPVPLAVLLLVLVAVQALPLALPFSPPWPMVGHVLAMLVLGVVFLVRSRR